VVGPPAERENDSLLLVTSVEIRQGPRGPQIDDQTAAGIAQWCRHFDRVTYVGVESSESAVSASSVAWVDADEGLLGQSATLLTLPRAYRPRRMVEEYRSASAMLRREIERHRHLCFTIGGMLGDWPAVGAFEAIRQRRRYAAWTDRAEPLVIRQKLAGASVPLRIAGAVAVPIIEAMARHIFRRSTVALLQGRDTFDFFANSASDPHSRER
jgi:colanic acid/amylovoran biosynthesis glycosyltransferase